MLLTVDPRGVSRSNSPAVKEGLDFQLALDDLEVVGTFDEHTIEVVGYDGSGALLEYDSSRGGDDEEMKVSLADSYLRTMSKTLPPEETDGENVGFLKFDRTTARNVAHLIVRVDRNIPAPVVVCIACSDVKLRRRRLRREDSRPKSHPHADRCDRAMVARPRR